VIAWSIIAIALLVFLFLLFARMVYSWVQVFARDFRPSGPLVLLLEAIFSATDPPLKALRRVLPPLRIGQVQLDTAFFVLAIVVVALYQATSAAARG
jgi:YggT family protein